MYSTKNYSIELRSQMISMWDQAGMRCEEDCREEINHVNVLILIGEGYTTDIDRSIH